jgi:predicted alpha-1,6-mannanase (GH76 family)
MKRFGFIFLAILPCLFSCNRTGVSAHAWADRADTAFVALTEHFWNTEMRYCNYDSAGDTTFHYWPQAHVLDIFTDRFLRTRDPFVSALYDDWYRGVPAANGGGFWNEFYDDMEWNGIAALRAYQASGDRKFLEAAKQLWEMIIPAWNERGGGGMTWKKGREWSKNACSNGPAAILAARLYRELGREEDLSWAERIYAWEKERLFDHGAIYDMLNGDTGQIARFCLTYNQGTFIGAAVDLYRITGDRTYLDDAILAADYTLDSLTVEGNILQPEGARDGGIFKGIFVRYFTQLILEKDLPEVTKQRYVGFLLHNGETLWTEGNTEGRFAPDWRQKPPTPSAMTPQLSGCMLLEALALLEREGRLSGRD